MDVSDIMREAHKGLKALEAERKKVLKHAAVMMLEATLPLETKTAYTVVKTTKGAKITLQKTTVTTANRQAKTATDAGLKGKVQKSADQALSSVKKRTDYGKGAKSIK
ncbi:hypothetical protein [Ligilactobacillus acidipiscis]|uniref:hypothetical protein n=1 Tax=Ligilactobacillus acidipiscis TaxID=89059 RepID=UPI0023F6F4E4|nr:hypothetical protein [Ligilactobacillus acidipiscis]WEV56434.1 hypothetical protein OZX66_09400 [Ligilactobacillus acidipiscis]